MVSHRALCLVDDTASATASDTFSVAYVPIIFSIILSSYGKPQEESASSINF